MGVLSGEKALKTRKIKAYKQKVCAQCDITFTPNRYLQKVCGPRCEISYHKAARERKAQCDRKDKLKIRKLERKPIGYFRSKAQLAFNAFIRERDYMAPCISCGETNPPDLYGGQWDCGHFKTVGGFPELRFEERNAYRQCKPCNAGSAKYGAKAATVAQKYEANLVKLFGQDLVDWLNGPHEMTHYRREDYIRIAATYRRKFRELKQKRAT